MRAAVPAVGLSAEKERPGAREPWQDLEQRGDRMKWCSSKRTSAPSTGCQVDWEGAETSRHHDDQRAKRRVHSGPRSEVSVPTTLLFPHTITLWGGGDCQCPLCTDEQSDLPEVTPQACGSSGPCIRQDGVSLGRSLSVPSLSFPICEPGVIKAHLSGGSL